MAHADLTYALAGLAKWARSSGIIEIREALAAALGAAELAEDTEALLVGLNALAVQPDPELEAAKAPAKKHSSKKGERARQEDGTFQADDPSTPEVDEAFVASDDAVPASVEP